jgi:hypothetical protein
VHGHIRLDAPATYGGGLSWLSSWATKSGKPIDEEILQNRKINAVKAIKVSAGATLREAMDIFYDRYDLLRASRSGEFVCGPDEYWEGFYS